MYQTTIFDIMYPKYKITKPIRLIELFAGYGSQALALKYLGVKFEHWKICEWAVKSIQAYKDIHFTDDTRNYSEVASKEEIQEMLLKWGISSNYNEPMTREQINRLSEEQLRTIFNNISATNNLVNIQDVKGDDLAIVNKDEYDYILTYSFPCQDLSLAGKGKGMADTSTRSGMLWEVERILNELKTTNSLPQILLMENVPQVHGSDNVEHFNKWQLALENMGYKNYFQDLIATDYGIPQTRNRCFMVSILGDYSYSFPKPIPLKLKLKDLLEKEVGEKYYLSDKQIKCLSSDKVYKNGYIRGNQFKKNINPDVCTTITASSSDRASDTFISIKNATKKVYLEATDNGGKDRGVCVGTYQYAKSDKFMNGKDRLQLGKETSDTLQTTPKEGVCYNDLRIRKLTPRECGRLMGVKDKDITNMLKNQSNSSAYHCFGDSIICTVLCAIFGELFNIDYKNLIESWNYNE
jgi:DNA (cytosine-5)-methyltransferase 1